MDLVSPISTLTVSLRSELEAETLSTWLRPANKMIATPRFDCWKEQPLLLFLRRWDPHALRRIASRPTRPQHAFFFFSPLVLKFLC